MNEFPTSVQPNPPPRNSPWMLVLGGVAVLTLIGAGALIVQWFNASTGVTPQVTSQDNGNFSNSTGVTNTNSVTNPYNSDFYVMGIEQNTPLEDVMRRVVGLGGKIIYDLPRSHALIVEINEAQRAQLEGSPGIEWIELDAVFVYLAQGISILPTLRLAQAPDFDHVFGDPPLPVDVFIIDSGASTDPSITYASKTAVRPNVPVDDTFGHGSTMAEFFSAAVDSSLPIKLHSISVGTQSTNRMSPGLIAEAVWQAIDAGAEVINLSMSFVDDSGTGAYGKYAEPFYNAVEEARRAGITVVVAAGSTDVGCPNILTNHHDTLSVAALDKTGLPSLTSCGTGYVQGDPSVADIYAMGVADFNGVEKGGTSLSSIFIATKVAEIMSRPVGSYDTNNNGRWDTWEVEKRLLDGVKLGEYLGFIQANPFREAGGATSPSTDVDSVPTGSTPQGNGSGEDTSPNVNFQLQEFPQSSVPPANSSSNNVSNTSIAQNTTTNPPAAAVLPPAPAANTQALSGGLVQCGGPDNPTGCNLCDLGRLMQRIINFLILLSIPLAAAMFAFAGFLYMTGGGNPTRISRAHKIFKNVLIGFLIAISAWLVVQTLLNAVFTGDFWNGGRNWFELECSREERLMNTNFGQLIENVIPNVQAPIVVTTSLPSSNTLSVSCPKDFSYNQITQVCVNAAGKIESPTIVSSSGGISGGMSTDPNARIYSTGQLEAKLQGTTQYAAQLQAICAQQGLSDCATARAIMAIESSGKSDAISPMGCVGLMQVCPNTARVLDPSLAGLSNAQITEKLKDPVYNMQLGVKYTAQMQNQFGQSTNSIAAYNGGPRANTSSNTCPGQTYWQCTANDGYAETRSYVPNVVNARNLLLP